jgi:hypothetical protein
VHQAFDIKAPGTPSRDAPLIGGRSSRSSRSSQTSCRTSAGCLNNKKIKKNDVRLASGSGSYGAKLAGT